MQELQLTSFFHLLVNARLVRITVKSSTVVLYIFLLLLKSFIAESQHYTVYYVVYIFFKYADLI